MRLKMFDIIDHTIALLEQNMDFYKAVESEIHTAFQNIFHNNDEFIVDISSRIKGKASLREKIVRNRLYLRYEHAQMILDHLSDTIGFIIECRFIEEEYQVWKHLLESFTIEYEDGYFTHKDHANIYLKCSSKQPQMQKNGFAIYRIDGYYIKDHQKVNFELQIKALVHSFWGDIEHKLVYKNTNFFVYDDFMKDLLASMKANLALMDRQLSLVYHQIQNMSKKDSGITQNGFEQFLSKAINDLFAIKMNESIGFTLNIKHTSAILGHYIFVKDIQQDTGNNERISFLFKTFKKLNHVNIDFENRIEMEEELPSNDVFSTILGNYLLEVMNEDYDWFVFFKMLFAIEPGNQMQDFCLFLNVIKNFLVDHYWLNTSFVKLPMDDAQKVHRECEKILAHSLVEIRSIRFIHNDYMIQINKCFIAFIEELEQRVISYDDFMDYQSYYYEEWKNRLNFVFQ